MLAGLRRLFGPGLRVEAVSLDKVLPELDKKIPPEGTFMRQNDIEKRRSAHGTHSGFISTLKKAKKNKN